MKVLFATSEALPYAASGGLADVSGSLPHAMLEKDVDCRIIMPLYQNISSEYKKEMSFIANIVVPVAWRRQYCGIFKAEHKGVTYYLIDNQYYFDRPGLYGHYDDAERFAFFCRAVFEILPVIDFWPDVVHANDWQCGLVPVYYRLFYASRPEYRGIKQVYTIHNVQYQGKYGMEILEDVFGIPVQTRSLVEQDGSINIMKGGIESADKVTTVSPTYAKELLDPWFAHGLDSILKARDFKLTGILNGIDVENYNPETDPDIYKKYSVDNIAGKAVNKKMLQEEMGLPKKTDAAIIGMVTRMVSHKGLDLVKHIVDRLLAENNVQLIILGSGDWEYEEFFKEVQERHKDKMAYIVGFMPKLARKIYAGSDIFLMPSKSEPCGLSQMVACRYGTVPIVRTTGGLADSITDYGDKGGGGIGFTFQTYNADDMFSAITRALDAYSNKKTWKTLVTNCMKQDFSWGRSAGKYIKLYKELTE